MCHLILFVFKIVGDGQGVNLICRTVGNSVCISVCYIC